MAKLYELSEAGYDFWATFEAVYDDPNLDWNEAQEYLNKWECDFDTKVEDCAKVVKAREAEIEALKAEEDRMAGRRKSLEKKLDNFKAYIVDQMKFAQREKIKTPLFSIQVQKSPASLEVFDEEAIPREFFIEVPASYKLDKKAALDAIKEGAVISGCGLKQGHHLRIR